MLITKIELINITTHKNTVIEFQQGLNLLYGNNGTGKSTILNMIGFVLFNFAQGNQQGYVRKTRKNTPKFGKIKIWILGLDDNLFIIERTIARSNPLVEVSDARTGIVIPGINNAIQLQEWLKTQLSLSQEINLSDLFRTSVGVPQGTFTEPFLRTAQKRKDFFNPVLQIEVYRIVWKKMLAIIKKFDLDLQEARNKETELETRLEAKEELVQKRDLNEDKLENAKNDLIKTKLEINTINEQYAKLKNASVELNECKNKIKLLNSRLENLKEAKKKIDSNINSAETAEKICSETQSDYEQFKLKVKEERELRAKSDTLRKLQEEITELKQNLTEIRSTKKEVESQINNIRTNEKDLPRLKKDFKESQKLQELLRAQRDKLIKITYAEEQLEKNKSKNIELTSSIITLEKELELLPEIKKKGSNLEELQKKSVKMEVNIKALDIEVNKYRKDMESSKEGLCPILNEQCRNIGSNSFKSIFQEKIDAVSKVLRLEIREFEDLKRELEPSNTIQEKLDELKIAESKLMLLKEQKIELGKEIKKLVDIIRERGNENEILARLTRQSDDIIPNVEKYNVLKEKVEGQLPKLSKKYDSLQDKLQPIEAKLTPLEKEREGLIHIPKKLSKINEELDKLRENHGKYQVNKKLAEELKTFKKELEKNKSELKDAEHSLNIEVQEKKKLEELFNETEFKKAEDDLANLREKKGILKNTIHEAENLLTELKEKLSLLEKTEEELDIIKNELIRLEFMKRFTEIIRGYFNAAGPSITDVLLTNINREATIHFRNIMDDPNIELIWDKEFLIKIKTSTNEKEFHHLSGGEQMAAALAVRLAILKILSNAEFAFFDEPTMNLDPDKRENLAKIIQRIKGFKQLFIISHDDTFEENIDNVIKFNKDENEVTTVEYITKSKDVELVWGD